MPNRQQIFFSPNLKQCTKYNQIRKESSPQQVAQNGNRDNETTGQHRLDPNRNKMQTILTGGVVYKNYVNFIIQGSNICPTSNMKAIRF